MLRQKKLNQDYKDDSDHIYYNVSIVNDSPVSIPATYYVNRKEAILENPRLYHMTVVSFTIPTLTVPIFIFQPQAYTVTLSYQDAFVKAHVLPFYSNSSPDSLTYIYQYQDFIDQVNKAFTVAYDALITSIVGTPPATMPPFFIMDPSTQIISLVAQTGYQSYNSDTSLNNTCIKIFVNATLGNFFNGIDYHYNAEGDPNGFDTQFIIKQNSNPNTLQFYTGTSPVGCIIPPPYFYTKYGPLSDAYIMQQQYAQTVTWYSPRSLQITTSLLPIASEFIPGGDDATRQIITDFQFPLADQIAQTSPYVQYFPQADIEYRLIDMISNEPLKKFDLQFYWSDDVQKLHPLSIPANNTLNIKFLFKKRKDIL